MLRYLRIIALIVLLSVVGGAASQQIFTFPKNSSPKALRDVIVQVTLSCGPSKQVLDGLRQDGLVPIMMSTEKVQGGHKVMTLVWFTPFLTEGQKGTMMVTETNDKDLTCITTTATNAKRMDPGTEM